MVVKLFASFTIILQVFHFRNVPSLPSRLKAEFHTYIPQLCSNFIKSFPEVVGKIVAAYCISL